MQTTTFDSTKQSLVDLLQAAATGEAQLPDFQRGWVWDDDHIRDLLASVSRTFPIGAVMLLEAGGDEIRFKARVLEGAEPGASDPGHLILDGQQRLTSLFQSLLSGKPVATRDAKGKPLRRWYYLDIRAALDDSVERVDAIVGIPEDRVVRSDFGRKVDLDLSSPEGEHEAHMFPLSKTYDHYEWRQGFNTYWQHDPEKTRLWDRFERQVLRAFMDFQLPVISLRRHVPKEAVCLVFEKVNTGGVSLTVFELLTATFAADEFELRPDWDARRKRLARQSVLSELASTDFLQAVTLVDTYEARRAALRDGEDNPPAVTCKRRDILRLTSERYRTRADAVEKGFHAAGRLLAREHVFDVKFLPYTTQLVPLAALLTVLGSRADDQHVHDKLVRWYWCGVFGELYGSGTETRFARDLPEVLAWIDGGSEPRTVVESNFAPERLLTLQTRRSAAYRGLYVLLLHEGARDFRTGEPSHLQTYFDEAVDIHHVFPRKWCADQGVDSARMNSIVNKTPLTARTNRIIGGNAPSTYLSSLERNHNVDPQSLDANLRSHFIDPEEIRADDFDRFFERRRDALLSRVAAATGKQLKEDASELWVVDVDADDTDVDLEVDSQLDDAAA